MTLISARKGAPNDGTGKGEVIGRPNAYSRSKQNSDAFGFLYQWGRKEPFTFATNSLYNGGDVNSGYGEYPVKMYNAKSELIYQKDNGGDNIGMTPIGGIIHSYSLASSMMETIKKPNQFYYSNNIVISQVGHSKELFNYYWTSYSRGTDGIFNPNNRYWHNTYLDGYIVLRSKSIYDPCPYGYRTFTNGTYNDFKIDYALTGNNYTGGAQWSTIWIVQFGYRSSALCYVGGYTWCSSSTIANKSSNYTMQFSSVVNCYNRNDQGLSYGLSLRCIEDATTDEKYYYCSVKSGDINVNSLPSAESKRAPSSMSVI